MLIFSQINGNLEETESYFIKNSQGNRTNLIDFSNHDATKWFASTLERLHLEQGVNSFIADQHGPEPGFRTTDSQIQKYPNQLIPNYLETVAGVTNSSLSIYSYKTQHIPGFAVLYPSGHTQVEKSFEDILQEMIPNILSLSIGGYSFIAPYAAGWPFTEIKPTPEQYIRWIQALTFLPSISLYRSPWEYKNETITQLARKFIDLHTEHAPLIIELAKRRLTGSPIIRPMWYIAPDDLNSWKIGDQFMLGEDIVVAPILTSGVRERSVYLPPGHWVDQHGKRFERAGLFKVEVPLEELAYFKRVH